MAEACAKVIGVLAIIVCELESKVRILWSRTQESIGVFFLQGPSLLSNTCAGPGKHAAN